MDDLLKATYELAQLINYDTKITYDLMWHPQKGIVKVWRVKQ